METVLSYAYVNVSVRKHFLSKKITAHVMSAAISDLLDKWEVIVEINLINIY